MSIFAVLHRPFILVSTGLVVVIHNTGLVSCGAVIVRLSKLNLSHVVSEAEMTRLKEISVMTLATWVPLYFQ